MQLVKKLARRIGLRRGLPPHPYPEQFSPQMDLPLQDGARRFILIASTPRCGSHYLGHMLKDSQQAGVPLEYLHPGNALHWQKRFGTADLVALFAQFTRHRTSANGSFCFKAHWSQFAPFATRVGDLTGGQPLDKIIWIGRKNQLSQAISLVIAHQTGVWISGATSTVTPRYNYRTIVEAARQMRDDNLSWQQFLAQQDPARTLVVVYEDMLKDPGQLERVRAFLDLSAPLQASSRTGRQSSALNDSWKARFRDEVTAADRWILEDPAWLPPVQGSQAKS